MRCLLGALAHSRAVSTLIPVSSAHEHEILGVVSGVSRSPRRGHRCLLPLRRQLREAEQFAKVTQLLNSDLPDPKALVSYSGPTGPPCLLLLHDWALDSPWLSLDEDSTCHSPPGTLPGPAGPSSVHLQKPMALQFRVWDLVQ